MKAIMTNPVGISNTVQVNNEIIIKPIQAYGLELVNVTIDGMTYSNIESLQAFPENKEVECSPSFF